ncbi:MAG: hypothetical protein ACJ0BT_00370 [Pseudohongiellaceae bacterium]
MTGQSLNIPLELINGSSELSRCTPITKILEVAALPVAMCQSGIMFTRNEQ